MPRLTALIELNRSAVGIMKAAHPRLGAWWQL